MLQQERLRNITLPHNLLIIGAKYSGKKTLVKELTDDSFVYVEGTVENIRELESDVNYIFTDVDDWNVACYSAMLYLLENNETAHIIITARNIRNLPNSICSRCVIEHMDAYTNVGNYCDSIGELQFYSDDMLNAVDRFEYNEDFDIDVFFTVLCNRLVDRILNGEDLRKELLVSNKYNAIKSTKSLNKKQFITNWKLDMSGKTDLWRRL